MGFLLALAAVAAGTATPPAPVTHAQLDVPQDKGEQQVVVQTREFPPGGASGWHIHHGVEIAYQISGETMFSIGSAPPRKLKAGESVMIPREVPHSAVSTGKVPARLVITLMVDKGPPLRETVPAPTGQ